MKLNCLSQTRTYFHIGIEMYKLTRQSYISQKAFDTVPHKRLFGKLSFYGIKGPVRSWIQAFLEDRVQSNAVDGKKCEESKRQSTHILMKQMRHGVRTTILRRPSAFRCIHDSIPWQARMFETHFLKCKCEVLYLEN